MRSEKRSATPLPRGWKRHVRSAILYVISYAFAERPEYRAVPDNVTAAHGAHVSRPVGRQALTRVMVRRPARAATLWLPLIGYLATVHR